MPHGWISHFGSLMLSLGSDLASCAAHTSVTHATWSTSADPSGSFPADQLCASAFSDTNAYVVAFATEYVTGNSSRSGCYSFLQRTTDYISAQLHGTNFTHPTHAATAVAIFSRQNRVSRHQTRCISTMATRDTPCLPVHAVPLQGLSLCVALRALAVHRSPPPHRWRIRQPRWHIRDACQRRTHMRQRQAGHYKSDAFLTDAYRDDKLAAPNAMP